MKIYINNLNLILINDIQKLLDEYLVKTEQYIEVYTNEGIYQIDNENIFVLIPNDGEVKILNEVYKDFTLIADYSYFEKKRINSLIGDKLCHRKIVKNIYKLEKVTNISLVIEKIELEKSKLINYDIYFEFNGIFDIKEIFIRQEIFEFLSLLN